MSLFSGVELVDRPDPANVRKLDLLPVPMLRKMMRYGIRIDVDHFRALSARLESRMRDLRCDIVNEIPPAALDDFLAATDPDDDDDNDVDENSESESLAVTDDRFNVDSVQTITSLLYDTLHLDQTSGVKTKRTKGGKTSTGKKTLEQLKREHPVVPLILEYRECSKLNGTYAKKMPMRAVRHPRGTDCPVCGRHHYTDEWRVHTQILTTRVVTGRTASKNPNLGNIPTRTRLGAEIRAGFIASDGHVIAQRDWSQIEVRLMADRSGDAGLIRIFVEERDPHIETAMRAFDISDPSKVDKILHRAPSKNVTFGCAYGLQEDGLLDLMAVTYATAGLPLPAWLNARWCAEFIAKWFSIYPDVRRYFDDEESKARRYGIVWTRCGRVRRIPEVRSCHPWIQAAGVRQGGNHGIQGYSADIMKLAMGEVDERLTNAYTDYGIESYPLLTIYDELLIETPEDDGDTIEAVQEDVMDNVLVDKSSGRLLCAVPIKSDGSLMKRWAKN